jgi:hypothetical protein
MGVHILVLPALRPCNFSRAWMLRGLMRRPWLLVNRATPLSSSAATAGLTSSQRRMASSATEPIGTVRVLLPLPVTVSRREWESISPVSMAASSARRRPEE